MPQLVKGGKHVLVWSLVDDAGRIRIPPEALQEHHFKEAQKLILMPGSHTSGGFGLAAEESIRGSTRAADCGPLRTQGCIASAWHSPAFSLAHHGLSVLSLPPKVGYNSIASYRSRRTHGLCWPIGGVEQPDERRC